MLEALVKIAAFKLAADPPPSEMHLHGSPLGMLNWDPTWGQERGEQTGRGTHTREHNTRLVGPSCVFRAARSQSRFRTVPRANS